jgi:hypothetical protein
MGPKRNRIPLVILALTGLGLSVACSDVQPTGPRAVSIQPEQAPLSGQLLATENGVEYEVDTGEVACPAILNSHVKYWVNINAVGARLFTFFAPHTRIGYLGRGVYRYRMTLVARMMTSGWRKGAGQVHRLRSGNRPGSSHSSAPSGEWETRMKAGVEAEPGKTSGTTRNPTTHTCRPRKTRRARAAAGEARERIPMKSTRAIGTTS